jgi:hypothetical protein
MRLRTTRTMLTRLAALAGSAVIAAGTLAVVSAGPAAAQSSCTSYTASMYLASSTSWGTFADAGVTSGSPIYVKHMPWGTWAYNECGTETIGSVTGTVFEIQAIYTSHAASPYCLADTTEGLGASLATCGANGTVFIGQISGDGILYYSRYLYDLKGQYWVLAVNSPSTDVPVITWPESGIGGSYFGRWYPPQIIT